jgi:hypothetical protein
MEEFSLGSALMCFRNTRGPSGFLRKYLLWYVVCLSAALAVFAGIVWFAAPEIGRSFVASGSFRSADAGEILALFSIIPVMFIFNAIFESAAYRHYIRGEGLSLQIKADEVRLLLIYILLTGIFLVTFIVLLMLTGLVSYIAKSVRADALSAIYTMVATPLMSLSFFVACILFAPAAALSIRSKKFALLSAPRLIKGKFWSISGAYFLCSILWLVVLFVMSGMTIVASAGLSAAIPGDVVAPLIISLLIIVLWSVMLVACAFYHFVVMGISAHAALTDTDWAGISTTADVFS